MSLHPNPPHSALLKSRGRRVSFNALPANRVRRVIGHWPFIAESFVPSFASEWLRERINSDHCRGLVASTIPTRSLGLILRSELTASGWPDDDRSGVSATASLVPCSSPGLTERPISLQPPFRDGVFLIAASSAVLIRLLRSGVNEACDVQSQPRPRFR